MIIQITIFGALCYAFAQANHGHHHNHAVGLSSPEQSQAEIVSSFRHALPGTNSFISMTQYFRVPPSHNRNSSLPEEVRKNPSSPSNQLDYFDPWNPRFKIPRVEATEAEWEEQLTELFEQSGLLGGQILTSAPKGLINLNYDIHVCVHLGTELSPEDSAYPPTALSYPGEGESADKLHTLVMVDMTMNNKLHWMVVNIPGSKVNLGQVVASYAGPNPAPGSGLHKYVVAVMEQANLLPKESLMEYKAESSCEQGNRDNFDFQAFRLALNLSEPVAANYFTEQYGDFVDNINSHCLKNAPLPTHPLYK